MIKLVISGVDYNITDYVDESSIAYADNIDETKAHGAFTIPFVKDDIFTAIDMSKPLPRLTLCVIEVDGEYTYWKVAEDKVNKVRKGDNPLYAHEVTLIEPTVTLEGRVLPDMTVTQPKGSIDNYVYDINILADEVTIVDDVTNLDVYTTYETTGVNVNNTIKTLDFTYGVSNDTTILEDNELKEVREYELSFNYEIYNLQSYYLSPIANPEATIELTVYADGTLIDTFTTDVQEGSTKFKIFSGNKIYPYVKTIKQSLKYTPSGIGEVITVKVRTTGMYLENHETLDDIEDQLWITKMGFNILTYQEGETSKQMLDDVVDKILLIQTQSPLENQEQEFTLDEQSRTRIANVVSPEFTFKGYTMWDALYEIGSYVGAIVYLGENDFTTIYFYFYDDEFIESDIEYLDEQQDVYLTDFVTGYEINAQNVINEDNERYVAIEPSETGWLSIRGNGIGEITDANATLQTSRPYYKSYKLLAKGLAFTMKDSTDNDVSFASTLEWDLTNFVVEQTEWKALLNVGEEVRTGLVKNKGNTVYYTQSQKNLFNLGYNDVILAPEWNTNEPANYAIVEAILCKAAQENPTYHFTDTYQPTISLFDMQFRIYYMPYSNARVTVYRDDAATLNTHIKYFNEQASINDMKALGDTAKRHVNRKGNIVSTYKGITTNIYNLIKLGMKNDRGEILTSYELSISPKLREFVLHYSKDNPNISAYKGVPSAYRQWEVPSDNLVYRKDKYSEFVYLSESDDNAIYTIYDTDQLLANFKPIPTGEKLTYAVLDIDYTGSGYTKKVEATVDTLSFGNTSAIIVEMQDNFSAGATQVEGIVTGAITQIRQADTQYVDVLGKIKNVKISTFTTKVTDSDIYPANEPVTTSGYESQLELQVDKDAREIYGVVQELVFRSAYSNIRVFSGIAKFNGIVAKGSTVEARPLLLKKGYFPNSETIDYAKTIQTTWDSTITNNQWTTEMDVPSGEYEGYIWVEIATNIPIVAVKTSEFDTLSASTLSHSLYIITSAALLKSNYDDQIDSTIEITDTITLVQSTDFIIELDDTITVSSSMSDNNFIFPVLDLPSTITLIDTINLIQSTNFIIELEDTISVSSTIVESDFTYPILDLTSTVAIQDTMNIYQSTDYVIDLSDTITATSSMSIFTEITGYILTLLSEIEIIDNMVLVQSTDYVNNLTSTITLSDNMTIVQSTDYVITLEDTIGLDSSISSVQSTDFTITLSDTLGFTSSITAVQSTDFIITLTDTLTLSSVISDARIKTWNYIGTTGSYDKSVTYIGSGSTCARIPVIEEWLETNYPADDYAYGYIIRAVRGNEDLVPCSPIAYYYQVT